MENYYILHKNEDHIVYTTFINKSDYEKKLLEYQANRTFYKIITYDELSKMSPFFSAAWELTPSSTVVVNMPKARDIHRQNLRPQRDAKFAPLDGEFMKALEKGDTVKQQQIATQKQKLRDITAHPAIESAQTADDLRKLTLDVLLSM